jgi:hypothetical protein
MGARTPVFDDVSAADAEVARRKQDYDFWNPSAVTGSPRPLPPEYVPEDAYSAFLRAAANRATFNTADGLAAIGDAIIPLDTGASTAPSWAQRRQENLDSQYRISVADQYYHPVATLAGQGFGILIDPLSVIGPRPATFADAAARGAGIQAVRSYGSNARMEKDDRTDGLATDAAKSGLISAMWNLITQGR